MENPTRIIKIILNSAFEIQFGDFDVWILSRLKPVRRKSKHSYVNLLYLAKWYWFSDISILLHRYFRYQHETHKRGRVNVG